MLLASYVRPRQAQPFTDLSDLETLPRGRVFAGTEGTERERDNSSTRFLADFGESWSLRRGLLRSTDDRGEPWDAFVVEGARRGRCGSDAGGEGDTHRRLLGGGSAGGRVRSLSPVQTFTSYETAGELPVLGTGCR